MHLIRVKNARRTLIKTSVAPTRNEQCVLRTKAPWIIKRKCPCSPTLRSRSHIRCALPRCAARCVNATIDIRGVTISRAATLNAATRSVLCERSFTTSVSRCCCCCCCIDYIIIIFFAVSSHLHHKDCSSLPGRGCIRHPYTGKWHWSGKKCRGGTLKGLD